MAFLTMAHCIVFEIIIIYLCVASDGIAGPELGIGRAWACVRFLAIGTRGTAKPSARLPIAAATPCHATPQY